MQKNLSCRHVDSFKHMCTYTQSCFSGTRVQETVSKKPFLVLVFFNIQNSMWKV